MNNKRRSFIKTALIGGTMYPATRLSGMSPEKQKKLQVVCVGGHPDDPESGCGGTLCNYSQAGHRVSVIYLTRGESGIPGKSQDESASIRTAEAKAACSIVGAEPHFLGQTDGHTFFNKAAVDNLHQLLEKIKPDIAFTHWPVDSHPDHQVASMLTYQCWLRLSKSFDLYYFEVNSGDQTMHFSPNCYIDISATAEKKKSALFQHKSQHPDDIYHNYHHPMQQFRGRAIGVKEAEAFIRIDARAIQPNTY